MSDGPRIQKRSCRSCVHLEYFEDGYEAPEPGFYCNWRTYRNSDEESAHLEQLNDPGYLAKSKRCHASAVDTSLGDEK